METKTIDEHLAELLLGYVKLEGSVTRMDGSKCFYFTDRFGVQHKYATPRPNYDYDTIKKRLKHLHKLDPQQGTLIPNALHIDNDEL